jgi:hypothetical protein
MNHNPPPPGFFINENGQYEYSTVLDKSLNPELSDRQQERRDKIGCAVIFFAALTFMFLLMNWYAERDYYKQLYRLDNCNAKHYTIQECKDHWTK